MVTEAQLSINTGKAFKKDKDKNVKSSPAHGNVAKTATEIIM